MEIRFHRQAKPPAPPTSPNDYPPAECLVACRRTAPGFLPGRASEENVVTRLAVEGRASVVSTIKIGCPHLFRKVPEAMRDFRFYFRGLPSQGQSAVTRVRAG